VAFLFRVSTEQYLPVLLAPTFSVGVPGTLRPCKFRLGLCKVPARTREGSDCQNLFLFLHLDPKGPSDTSSSQVLLFSHWRSRSIRFRYPRGFYS